MIVYCRLFIIQRLSKWLCSEALIRNLNGCLQSSGIQTTLRLFVHSLTCTKPRLDSLEGEFQLGCNDAFKTQFWLISLFLWWTVVKIIIVFNFQHWCKWEFVIWKHTHSIMNSSWPQLLFPAKEESTTFCQESICWEVSAQFRTVLNQQV